MWGQPRDRPLQQSGPRLPEEASICFPRRKRQHVYKVSVHPGGYTGAAETEGFPSDALWLPECPGWSGAAWHTLQASSYAGGQGCPVAFGRGSQAVKAPRVALGAVSHWAQGSGYFALFGVREGQRFGALSSRRPAESPGKIREWGGTGNTRPTPVPGLALGSSPSASSPGQEGLMTQGCPHAFSCSPCVHPSLLDLFSFNLSPLLQIKIHVFLLPVFHFFSSTFYLFP